MSTELVRIVPEQRRCALYRHFDKDEVLLYVGISDTPVDRTHSHARTSEWVKYANHAEVRWLGSRALAEDAERYAIQDEEPIFNRQHAVGDVEQRIADYVRRREFEDLAATLESYEHLVEQFLSELPVEVRKQAEERAQQVFDNAGCVVDRTFPAHVLRLSTRYMKEREANFVDGGEQYAYGQMLECINTQLKRINDRQQAEQAALDPWAAAVASDNEPPF